MIESDIDFKRIKWVKNVKREKGDAFAYAEFNKRGDVFLLHWPNSKKRSADQPSRDDIVVLFQNYKNKGILLSHLVEVLDDASFTDRDGHQNFVVARKVRVLYFSNNLEKSDSLDFQKTSYGATIDISVIGKGLLEEQIQQHILNLFDRERINRFSIETSPERYLVTLPPNKIHKESQQFSIRSRITTLIGKNGCGKSAILESIFQSIHQDSEYNVICFSSGQNELYSGLFEKIQKERKHDFFSNSYQSETDYDGQLDEKIQTFYFNNNWSRILIFFALVFKEHGLINSFIESLNIPTRNTRLTFPFQVNNTYIKRVETEKVKEERYSQGSSLLKSKFHNKLTGLVESTIHEYKSEFGNEFEPGTKKFYEFDKTVNEPKAELSTNTALRLFEEKNPQTVFNFFWYCANINNPIINLDKIKLYFDDWELSDLSDGEYQLLVISALLDIFDNEQTVFLLDEIDSHLYFENISKAWSKLREIKGFLFTTTHIVDSIIQNDFHSVRTVSKGKVKEKEDLNELLERLESLSEGEYRKKKIATQLEYLALVEDKTDWIIFRTLARKKLGDKFDLIKFDKIHPVKCSSGYQMQGDDFGGNKKNWVREFAKSSRIIKTKEIFLICDRDKLPSGNFEYRNSKKACSYPQCMVEVYGDAANNLPVYHNNKKPHLLSWRRTEIENYLCTFSVLEKNGLLDEAKNILAPVELPVKDDPMDDERIEGGNRDFKELLKPLLYKQKADGNYDIGRWDYDKLQRVLDDIPPSEISGDIVNMYNCIISKIS